MSQRRETFLDDFLKNHAALYAFIMARGVPPHSAEDVLQNVAGVLWEKYDSYEQSTNFKAWAFAVTRVQIARYMAGRKRDSRVLCVDEETLEGLETLEEEGHNDLIEFQKAVLTECMTRLGATAQRLVKLRYGDGMSFDEVAKMAKRSSGALRIQICRIRKSLRDCVSKRLRGAVV